MGIMNFHLVKIGQSVKQLCHHNRQLRIAILGYPSMAVDKDTVIEAFDEHIESTHKDEYALESMLSSFCDCKIRIFDIVSHHEVEEILDLNQCLPQDLEKQFDLVLDSSCLEHCFNVAQAFKNICEMTALGGHVITIAPIYLFNHGYYNINPIMHQDGFSQNGFTVVSQHLINNNGAVVTGFSAKKTPPRQIFILTVATKTQEVEFRYPIQTHKGLGAIYE